MKLFLTSNGLKGEKARQAFLDFFGKAKGKRAVLIFTIRSEEDWQWLDYYDGEMKSLGLRYDGVNISEDRDLSNLKDYDLYYVCGGNTFYILDRLRKTKLDQVLISEIRKGKFFFGVSAGSIIAGPDIAVAELGDGNDIELKDLKGLGFVSFSITPHFNEAEKAVLADFQINWPDLEIITLADGEAVLVENDTIRFVKQFDSKK